MAPGLPVLTVGSLVTRPTTDEQLRAAVAMAAGGSEQGPLEVVWSPIPVDRTSIDGPDLPAEVSWEHVLRHRR